MSWYLDSNNKLTHDSLPESIENNFTPPYPATMWYVDENNKLNNTLLPEVLINDAGAFNKNPNLTEIELPSTLVYIGPYAFNDTGLSAVELPDECEYYATSFPEGCVVTGGHLIE